MRGFLLASFLTAAFAESAVDPALKGARDRQDRPGLEKKIAELSAGLKGHEKDAAAHYKLALAHSYLAEIATETRDKGKAKSAAEAGIAIAERAVSMKPEVSEYHRILGTLCGQVIPANLLSGMKYGKCALDSINKAIEIDPKSALAYVSRGVGNYYLPAAFGGGVETAVNDFKKALALQPQLPEAHLWLGVALRKLNRNADARKQLSEAVRLNPERVWAQQQLAKTPTE